jgi:outer membrane protein
MKRLLLIAFVTVAIVPFTRVQAQKIAFVDIQYILDNMPEYSTAQAELDRLSAKWQKEIEGRYEQIQLLRESYNAEAILLTPEMKNSRLEDITKKEKEARDLQSKRFGVKGDLFKKRKELIQPVQDQIYEAVKEMAGTSYYAVFDISGQSNLLFANEKYDKTNTVMKKLGIRPGEGGSDSTGKSEEQGTDSKPAPEENNSNPRTGGENPRR